MTYERSIFSVMRFNQVIELVSDWIDYGQYIQN